MGNCKSSSNNESAAADPAARAPTAAVPPTQQRQQRADSASLGRIPSVSRAGSPLSFDRSVLDQLEPLTDVELEIVRRLWSSAMMQNSSQEEDHHQQEPDVAQRTSALRVAFEKAIECILDDNERADVDDIVHTIGSGAYHLHDEVDLLVTDLDSRLLNTLSSGVVRGEEEQQEQRAQDVSDFPSQITLRENILLRLVQTKTEYETIRVRAEQSAVAPLHDLLEKTLREIAAEKVAKRREMIAERVRLEKERELQMQEEERRRNVAMKHYTLQHEVYHRPHGVRPAPPPPAKTPVSSGPTPRTPGGSRWPGKGVPAAPSSSRGATPRAGAGTGGTPVQQQQQQQQQQRYYSSHEPAYDDHQRQQEHVLSPDATAACSSGVGAGTSHFANTFLEMFVDLVDRAASEVVEQSVSQGRAASPEERRQHTLSALNGMTRQWQSSSQARAESGSQPAARGSSITTAASAQHPAPITAALQLRHPPQPRRTMSGEQQQQHLPPMHQPLNNSRHHSRENSGTSASLEQTHPPPPHSKPVLAEQRHLKQQHHHHGEEDEEEVDTLAQQQKPQQQRQQTTTPASSHESSVNSSTLMTNPNRSIKNIDRAALFAEARRAGAGLGLSPTSGVANDEPTAAVDHHQQQEEKQPTATAAPQQQKPQQRTKEVVVMVDDEDDLPDEWIKIGNGCFRNPRQRRVFDPSRPREYMDEVTGQWLNVGAIG